MSPTTAGPFCNPVQLQIPKFVSQVPDQTAWVVDALRLFWEDLDSYAFPPVSLLNKVVSKVMDQGCHRTIAPGWPNMPWFWDLVGRSVQIPFMLPLQWDLVTQPFLRLLHHDFINLKLHSWLLGPPSFRNKGSFYCTFSRMENFSPVLLKAIGRPSLFCLGLIY